MTTFITDFENFDLLENSIPKISANLLNLELITSHLEDNVVAGEALTILINICENMKQPVQDIQKFITVVKVLPNENSVSV